MSATLEITPDQSIEIQIEDIPQPGHHFYLNGMFYLCHDVIWNKLENIFKPTIVLYSKPYQLPKKDVYND